MLRMLTILAVLLAVAQAAVPTPRQASDHHADGSQPVTRDPQSDKKQPTPAPTQVHPVSAQRNEEPGKTVGQADAQKAIRISEFPPVSVTRDWIDRLAIFFTGILVIVGFLGVRYAKRSLNAIEGQLAEIKTAGKQTEQMIAHAGVQANAIERQVCLMEDTAKKQLRAYLAIVSAELRFLPDGLVEACLELGNSGATPAYSVAGACRGLFSQYPLGTLPPPPPETRRASTIIAPNKTQIIITLRVRPSAIALSPGEVLLSVQPHHYVCCAHGRYEYEDIFKDRHFINFQMIFGGPAGIRVDEDEKGIRAKMAMDTEGNEAG